MACPQSGETRCERVRVKSHTRGRQGQRRHLNVRGVRPADVDKLKRVPASPVKFEPLQHGCQEEGERR